MKKEIAIILTLTLFVGVACDEASGDWGDELAIENDSSEEADLESIPIPPLENDEVVYEEPEIFESEPANRHTYWTGWFSEENPAGLCSQSHVVNGYDCSGSYCDNQRLKCTNPGITSTNSSYWTSYFSEENQSWRYCSWPYGWLAGIDCHGSYCDNIAMRCITTNKQAKSCFWGGWFSEEDPPFNAPYGYQLRGIQCGGSYCDNKRYYYCNTH